MLTLLNFFFPGACALCKCALISSQEVRYGLCEKCRNSISLYQGSKCNLCGKPLISEIETCMWCRNSERTLRRLWLLFPYMGKYRKLLMEYKFRKNLFLADFFAEKILEVIVKEPCLKDIMIVPVPPRPGKIKHTGWDQVDHLLKRLKKNKNCPPIFRCLKRHKSMAQKKLNRSERLENLKGRIYLNKNVPKRILLIDDVLTTGSTMEACASVLKEGGAEVVYGLCLFFD